MGLGEKIGEIFTLCLHMQISAKPFNAFSSLSNYFVFHLANYAKAVEK